jgi:rhodanese-related sulfurtransferase
LPEPLALSPAAVQKMQRGGHLVLDTRPPAQYANAHIRGSLQVGLSGQFATWAGTMVRPEISLILVAEDLDSVREARTRLARVGLEKVTGYLADGILAWDADRLPVAATEQISVEELRQRIGERTVDLVIDVRKAPEWDGGHIADAVHMPLNRLSESALPLDRDARIAVVCAGGYRSTIATSILEQMGFRHVSNVVGGMTAWTSARFETAA